MKKVGVSRRKVQVGFKGFVSDRDERVLGWEYSPETLNFAVDGGVLKNFPATTLRPLCDTLIGINASPMVAEDYKPGLVSVALRSYHFMMKANILHDKEVCDLLVEPVDMGNYDTFDVGKGREIFEVGYASTKALLTPAFLKKVRLH